MSDLKNGCNTAGDFKEAVCIDAGRVFDSCCQKDCLEDLRVFFNCDGQEIINTASNVRLRCAEVLNADVEVTPVNFNKGFFACDITFCFLLTFDVFTAQNTCPTSVTGVASYSKKVILFGGEGNVKLFSNTAVSDCTAQSITNGTTNSPKCVVGAVDPVPLGAKLTCVRDCYEDICCLPQCVCDILGGNICTDLPKGTPTVLVSLGLFSIVQLIRNVQMLVPVFDYCIPEKTCADTIDETEPCDAFRKINFPFDDFFPPRPANIDNNCCSSCE